MIGILIILDAIILFLHHMNTHMSFFFCGKPYNIESIDTFSRYVYIHMTLKLLKFLKDFLLGLN